MKVSHELPLKLMHHSDKWNDYEYCLPHLVDKYDQYRTHFQVARLNKRFIMMDNGLFEGVTHTTQDLLSKINLIRPNVFIVPDAWNDSTTTLVNAKNWILNHKPKLPEGTHLMAVLQGKTLTELITSYQTLVDMGYKHIAFNHSSIAYQDMFKDKESSLPEDKKILNYQMFGRMELIRKLVETNTIVKSVYHHLLGCSLPQEFMAYKDWDFIKSVDTSNPILVGADGNRYQENGLTYKPKEKLEYYFEKDLSSKIEDITFNVQKFKQFIK
jgi:hypothetical protein